LCREHFIGEENEPVFKAVFQSGHRTKNYRRFDFLNSHKPEVLHMISDRVYDIASSLGLEVEVVEK